MKERGIMSRKLRTREKLGLIFDDATAIKVILFILVVIILTYFFCYLGVGVEIVLFLVRL